MHFPPFLSLLRIFFIFRNFHNFQAISNSLQNFPWKSPVYENKIISTFSGSQTSRPHSSLSTDGPRPETPGLRGTASPRTIVFPPPNPYEVEEQASAYACSPVFEENSEENIANQVRVCLRFVYSQENWQKFGF